MKTLHVGWFYRSHNGKTAHVDRFYPAHDEVPDLYEGAIAGMGLCSWLADGKPFQGGEGLTLIEPMNGYIPTVRHSEGGV